MMVAAEQILASGRHRAELTAYCRHMLGSRTDAEDAVQETMLRAWRGAARFEGRSSVRTWLYRIATNVCLDALGRAGRAPVPIEEISEPLSVSEEPEPPERALAAERARCAVVATVSALPARQRAVLLLRDVLSWRASDVADLLGTSVAGVNSALQRAHAALGAIDPERLPEPKNVHRRELVARYVAAFAEDDIDALVALSART